MASAEVPQTGKGRSPESERRHYLPIEDYGLIGDLHTVALVGLNGSIDFMCFPDFDSPTIFARILDSEKGGHFQISPCQDDSRHKQFYLEDSNVLLTRFLSPAGIAEVFDYMCIGQQFGHHALVREVKALRGESHLRMECRPRFDYARSKHRIEERRKGEVVFISENPSQPDLLLRIPVDYRIDGDGIAAEFTLKENEFVAFILEEARDDESPSSYDDFARLAYQQTVDFWHQWVNHSSYDGLWREMVNRSALVLKLMVSHTHGSLVAAPTFGLPEHIGATRNWDYRYTWIRDAAFTIYAFLRLGYTEEARHFMRWLETRCDELSHSGSLDVLYGLDGCPPDGEEFHLDLHGYMGSRPVRVGNAAVKQLQLDIHGALLDSIYLYNKYAEPIQHSMWLSITRMVDWVCENWKRPDRGIWELRNQEREFLSSRLMCWVAVDRGIRLAMKRSFPAPLDRWYTVRDEIYRNIFDDFWNPDVESFVMFKGSNRVDASILLMPMMKFISPTDNYWLPTLRKIEKDLVKDALVKRYLVDDEFNDGFENPEGTFTMCTFWYLECLSRAGDLDKARHYFEKAMGYSNHLGLFSEELGQMGEHLGNYPQAYTHLALISCAYDLDRRIKERSYKS